MRTSAPSTTVVNDPPVQTMKFSTTSSVLSAPVKFTTYCAARRGAARCQASRCPDWTDRRGTDPHIAFADFREGLECRLDDGPAKPDIDVGAAGGVAIDAELEGRARRRRDVEHQHFAVDRSGERLGAEAPGHRDGRRVDDNPGTERVIDSSPATEALNM